MMAKVRILWVHSRETNLSCGETYDESVIRDAGYDPADLVARGEAERLSPEPAAEKPQSRPAKKGK